MDNSTPLSFFKKQIQIGETTIPLGFIFLVAFFMAAIMGINSIYLKRRNQIISYLKKIIREYMKKFVESLTSAYSIPKLTTVQSQSLNLRKDRKTLMT